MFLYIIHILDIFKYIIKNFEPYPVKALNIGLTILCSFIYRSF